MNIFRKTPWLRKAGLSLGILSLGTGAVLLPACGDPTEISEGRQNVTTEDYEQTSQISESIGEVATIRSPIQEVVDENGVVLESESGGVLVLNIPVNSLNRPSEDVPLQVTGQVFEFTVADVESTYGLYLEENLYVDYEQQPAIYADTWALAPKAEMLAEQPEAYYNQRIALEGDARVLSSDAMALFEDGWIDDVGILAVGIEQSLKSEGNPIEEGESVTVTGTVQPFDQKLLDQYDLGLTPEEMDEFANRYTERPVIVVDSTYPTAVDE